MNDIALYKLPDAVNLTRQIQVACLPQQPSSTYPAANQTAWVVGWYSSHLKSIIYVIKIYALN